jgi:hypothetical protein
MLGFAFCAGLENGVKWVGVLGKTSMVDPMICIGMCHETIDTYSLSAKVVK